MARADVETAIAEYRRSFGSDPEAAAFGPGRVNLIGEHTDYNDGFVLPFALPYRTVVVGGRSNTGESTVIAQTMEGDIARFVIGANLTSGEPSWANYIKGVAYYYLGDLPPGAQVNAVICSNVPLGAGVSSSAALEVAFATFLEVLFGLHVDPITKALRCQRAEIEFAHTPCGIMDQFISCMGKKDHLLLIDCRHKTPTPVPFPASEVVLLVCNSNVKHSLGGSEYPVRVKQCQEAVEKLQKRFPSVQALRDVSPQMLEEAKDDLTSVVYRRARHVVTEQTRVLEMIDALKSMDFERAGELMYASHASMRDDYEVSCREIDGLVDIARKVDGVFGSRLTGGGFGGCTVTLVKKEHAHELEATLKREYKAKYDMDCDVFVVEPADGSNRLSLHEYGVTGGCDWRDVLGEAQPFIAAGIVALAVAVAAALYLRRNL